MMISTEMKHNRAALNEEQLDAVWGGGLLDLVGEGIGYLCDEMIEKIDKLFPKKYGCSGEQTVPGLNVY